MVFSDGLHVTLPYLHRDFQTNILLLSITKRFVISLMLNAYIVPEILTIHIYSAAVQAPLVETGRTGPSPTWNCKK